MDTQSKIEKLKSGFSFLAKIKIRKLRSLFNMDRAFCRIVQNKKIESVIIVIKIGKENPSYFSFNGCIEHISHAQNRCSVLRCFGEKKCQFLLECRSPICAFIMTQFKIKRARKVKISLEIWAKFIETK